MVRYPKLLQDISWHYTGSLHYYISKVLPLLFFQMTKVPLRGQKSVRNQSETGQTQPLSLSPLPIPHPLTRTPTPTPIPISTTTTATASAAGTTVSFRTVSGPHKLILLPNLKSNAFTHGSLLSLLDLLLLLLLPLHAYYYYCYYAYSYSYSYSYSYYWYYCEFSGPWIRQYTRRSVVNSPVFFHAK